MNLIRRALLIGILVLVLAALGAGGYFSLKFLIARFEALDERTRMTIIALVGVLAIVAIIAKAIRRAGQSQKANQLLNQKGILYQNLINLWGGILWHGLDADDPVVVALLEDLRPLDRLLILYGGGDVVKAHATLRALVRNAGLQNGNIRSQWGALVLAMREDLGSGADGLTAQDVSDWLFVPVTAPVPAIS